MLVNAGRSFIRIVALNDGISLVKKSLKTPLLLCCYFAMVPYGNKSGNSGVIAYEESAGSIAVQFVDGAIYTYTNASAGAGNVRQMKALAKKGSGLSTFISTTVKNRYAQKS